MTYLPLAYLIITAAGGCMALANITPVAPVPRPVTIGDVTGRAAYAFGTLYPRVTTPPGDPTLFADVRCQPYTPPKPAPIRARLRPRPCCLPAPAHHWAARVA